MKTHVHMKIYTQACKLHNLQLPIICCYILYAIYKTYYMLLAELPLTAKSWKQPCNAGQRRSTEVKCGKA